MIKALFLMTSLFFNNGPKVERPYNGGILNEGSTIRMNWAMSHDTSLGVAFDGWQGVDIRISEDGKKFFYRVDYRIKAVHDLKAFELTVVIFDVFQRFKENFRSGRVGDIKKGQILEGFFEKEVTIDEARFLGGSFIYTSSSINVSGKVSQFDEDRVFVRIRNLVKNFRSSWLNL